MILKLQRARNYSVETFVSADDDDVNADSSARVGETVSDKHARDDQRTESSGAPVA